MTTPNKVYVCTTRTNTPTVSFSKTPTQTITPTQTPTNSRTPSKTPTQTKTPTKTSTSTLTTTPTPSQTPTITPTKTPTNTPTNTTSNTPTPTKLPILYFTGPRLAEGETTLQYKGKFTFRPTGNENGLVEWKGDTLEGTGKLLVLDSAGRPTTQELNKTYGVINDLINIDASLVDIPDYEVAVELKWPVKCQPVGTLKIPFTVERNIPPVTPSSTRTPTRTSTKTPSPTSTHTPSNTPSNTQTKTPTPSNSPTPTNTRTQTPTATMTASMTPTKTQTSSITPTPTQTETSYSNCVIVSTPYPDPIEYNERTQKVVTLGNPNINIRPIN